MSANMQKGQIVGYIRVSTLDQNLDRQLDGITCDRIFSDKASGKDCERSGLNECLAYLREGDTLVVHEISRLARNLKNLLDIVSDLNARGVTIRFVMENLTFKAGVSDPFSELQLSLLSAFCDFERKLLLERQRQGIAQAKMKGRYANCGRKKMLSDSQVSEIRQLAESGMKKIDIARKYGVSRFTVYKCFAA